MKKLRTFWKYRKDIYLALDQVENEGVTPQVLGWHFWGFVAGKKPAIYCDGEVVKNDYTIMGWFKFNPPKDELRGR